MSIDEIKKGLVATIIFLAIECYSEDPEQRKKIERMGTAINGAISELDALDVRMKEKR